MIGPEFNRLKKIIDEHILDFIPEIDPKSNNLYESMKYSLLAGGKRIRPVIMLAAYELCTGYENKLNFALPFACAAEYIQTYSLIHDDLPAMDNDDYRRGKLTNHKVFGEDIAILAGDGLLSVAYEAISKDMLLYLGDVNATNKMIKAMFALSKGIGVRGMVAGQLADLEAENKACSPELLDFIHLNKTASFIQGCVTAGCYLGGGTKQQLNACEIYGENLGLAFQIIDDIMDEIGDPKELGKNVGVDKVLNKSTYPALYGIETSKAKANELISKAYDAIYPFLGSAGALVEVLDYLKGQIA